MGQGRPEDGEPLLRKAVEISARENGREDPRTIEAQIQHGEALVDLGKDEEAIALLKPAIEAARRAHHKEFEGDGWRWLSMAQIAQGDYDDGIASARASIAALGPVPAGQAPLLNATLAYLSLASALNSDRRTGVTEAARAGLRLAQQRDGANNTPHASQLRSLLGQGLIRDGEAAAGLRELEKASADSRTLLGADHIQTVQMTYLLGGGLLEAGEVRKATEACQASLDSALRHPEALNPLAFASMHLTLANALVAARETGRALPHYESAEKFFAEADGADTPSSLGARSARALALTRLGRLREGDALFASIPMDALAGANMATYESRLAVLRSLQGRHAEAVSLARSGVEGLKKLSSKTLRAQSLARLGAVLLAAKQRAEAVAPLEQAVALFKEVQIEESPDRRDAGTDLRRALAAG
jgi:tetratricopeptide (TPR) repeat protein